VLGCLGFLFLFVNFLVGGVLLFLGFSFCVFLGVIEVLCVFM